MGYLLLFLVFFIGVFNITKAERSLSQNYIRDIHLQQQKEYPFKTLKPYFIANYDLKKIKVYLGSGYTSTTKIFNDEVLEKSMYGISLKFSSYYKINWNITLNYGYKEIEMLERL